MQKLEHAPAPWVIDGYDKERYFYLVNTALRGTDVPNLGYEVALVSGAPNSPKGRATAALIAAAPELLSACQTALRALQCTDLCAREHAENECRMAIARCFKLAKGIEG